LQFFFAPDGKINIALEWTGIMWQFQQPSSNLRQKCLGELKEFYSNLDKIKIIWVYFNNLNEI